jgi:hypothetical protein
MNVIIRVSAVMMLIVLLGAGGAGTQPIDAGLYYEKAQPLDDPGLPEGLRIVRWGEPAQPAAAPVITSPCLRYDPGEFMRMFFNPPHAKRVREIFAEAGVDADKVSNLLGRKTLRDNGIVTIFDEGYMMLVDRNGKTTYIFPIGKNMAGMLFRLSR